MLRYKNSRASINLFRATKKQFSTKWLINVALGTPDITGRSYEYYKNSHLLIRDGKIERISSNIADVSLNDAVYDVEGLLVTPGFVDPHTHLFPSKDRANEFSLRSIKSYKEIAASGGGILSSVNTVRGDSVKDLVEANIPVFEQFFAQGTTTVEVKSGYGLTVLDEVKQLEAIRELQCIFFDKLTIVPTFLGAHAVPKEFKGNTQKYVDLICSDMIPYVASNKLAKYCDVFCEEGYFDASASLQILQCAKAHGLQVRLHADEFVDSGGASLAARLHAHSADHLMAVSEQGMSDLATAGVVATVLPGTTVFLGKGHGFAPMRKMITAGCRVAIATDYNPGSSVFQSMPQMMQLVMSNGGLTVEESMLAATYNAAKSLGLENKVGTLQPGADADFIVWSLDDVAQIPYYGAEARHRISAVGKRGKIFENPSAELSALHRTAFANRSKLSSTPIRSFSSSAVNKSPQRVSDILFCISHQFVEVNEWGQITKLPPNCDLASPPPFLDSSLDHAPKRRHLLSAKEKDLAVVNALKYFDKSLHQALKPVFQSELETYGHIYCYHLLPTVPLQAIPFSDISAKLPECRAMTHMILNNLDPAVAQFSQELITYGGNGAVFSNWAQFHITVRLLGRMTSSQSLVMNSGHPQGLFPKANPNSPAAVISNGIMVHNYSTPENLDRLYALGVSMYGQMTAGSWMYIGPQGIVHGTTLTVAQAMELHAQDCLRKGIKMPSASSSDNRAKGKVFLTSGLGGMSGAQPKAATINGIICIVAETNEYALKKRHSQGWLHEMYHDISKLLQRAKAAQDGGESISIGYVGNIVELWEAVAATPITRRPIIHIASDQSSLHNPYNGGYYPAGLTFAEANAMMTSDPERFKAEVKASLRRHLGAIDQMRNNSTDNTFFFDYGNAFLLECHRAGCVVDPAIMSYVECIMGPEFFDFGFGPYRWVCTSGLASELDLTDKIAASVLQDQITEQKFKFGDSSEILPQLEANLVWILSAKQNKLVVGSQARILYSDLDGRIECAVRMNRAVRDGSLTAPVVIGRDHHDVSGTDSPWRETANIRDGSNITADMAVQNVVGDAMRGASWVSLHNGGGTGWGEAVNGGFGLVLDGTEAAEMRARDMIFFDVANGITRRARSGNPHAISTIRKLAAKYPDFKPFLPILE